MVPNYDQSRSAAGSVKIAVLTIVFLLFATVGQSSDRTGKAAFRDDSRRGQQESRRVDPRLQERLYNVMAPLLRAMDHPEDAKQVRVGITDDPEINAANAGNGQFLLTRGLLEKANDEQLRGVLAHEIAHEDLGHVAKLQMLGTGLNLGIILLEKLFPGSSAITPIAGSFIANSYSRSEELAADRHGVEILRRAGYSKQVMIDALTWISRTSGGRAGGGFLSTHPATEERIASLKRLQ
jgi:predicted Zn-dependent protease